MKRSIGKKIVDPEGYNRKNKNNFTDYKVIPSNNISMQEVDSNILAVLLDSQGNPQGFEFMSPGEEYFFGNSEAVVEIPKYQMAGTFDSTDQGQIPEWLAMGLGNQWMSQNNNLYQNINPEDSSFMTEDMSIYSSPEQLNRMNANRNLNTQANNYNEEGQPIDTSGNYNNQYNGDFQFFNPYGGVDIPTAAYTLGTSIEEGNTLGTVASGLKLATGLGRNFFSGMGLARRNKNVMQDYRNQQRDYVTGANRPVYMEKGGKIEKALTGEYMFGMDDINPMAEPNAELETGEYIQHPNTEIQQIEGKTHEQGGEKVVLEEGTRILSDHLKLGNTTAKALKKQFDLDLKASDTYAKVLDKFNSKSGLSKIIKEQEEIIKKMDKQQKETENEDALGLNMQYLSGKMKDLEDKKKPLEDARKILFDTVYEEQEKSKPKDERDDEIFERGGEIKALADKYGIPFDRVKELVKKYQQGGVYSEEQRRARFRDFLNQSLALGFTGDVNPEAEDLGVEAGKLQSWMVSNYPDVVSDYARGVDMTAKGVDLLKSSNPELFNSLGLNIDKPSVSYTPEEKSALANIATEQGLIDDNFWREQFNDNRWSYRYPTVPIQTSSPSAATDLLQTAPTVDNLQATPGDVSNVAPSDIAEGSIVERPVDSGQSGTSQNRMGVFLMPDQNPLPPTGLQPHLKVTRRFDRVNPALISPEQNIEEIRRQEAAAIEVINQLPDSQRAAALANLNANTQQNINKVISETARINSQIQSQADMQNAQTQRMEENAGAQDALSYEQRQLTALAKTQNDFVNFYNTQQANNVRNFNTINNLNLTNAMYDDFQFTGQGIEKTSPDLVFTNSLYKNMATQGAEKKKTVKRNYSNRFKK